jgi:hypothetical protein
MAKWLYFFVNKFKYYYIKEIYITIYSKGKDAPKMNNNFIENLNNILLWHISQAEYLRIMHIRYSSITD